MATHEHDEEHKHHSWLFYTVIAVFLGLITFVELGPLFEWFYLPTAALLALSVVKFAVVVALFMHLWDDPPVFTQMFVAPLVGGLLMVTVLMVLFQTFRPAPFEDSMAIQERYGDVYAKTCSSWLRSHKSQRLYCASPALDKDRVAYMGVTQVDANGDGQLDRIEMPTIKEVDDGGLGDRFKAAGDADAQKAFLITEGATLYQNNCQACHQENGQGVVGTFPPLAASDYEGYQTPEGHANIVLNGLQGKIVVNGTEYNGAMQAYAGLLTDAQIAAIISYERNSWGNDDGWITPDKVASLR
ncbi:MAG: c-type cytochrome [Myxococcota bacterium]